MNTTKILLGGDDFRLTAVPTVLADMLDSLTPEASMKLVENILSLQQIQEKYPQVDILAKMDAILGDTPRKTSTPKRGNDEVELPFGHGYLSLDDYKGVHRKGVPTFAPAVCSSKETVNMIHELTRTRNNIDEIDTDGRTALMYATANIDQSYIFNLLTFLRLRPDMRVTDTEGKNAFDYLPKIALKKDEYHPNPKRIQSWLNCFLEYCESREEKDWIVSEFKRRFQEYDETYGFGKKIDEFAKNHDEYLIQLGRKLI